MPQWGVLLVSVSESDLCDAHQGKDLSSPCKQRASLLGACLSNLCGQLEINSRAEVSEPRGSSRSFSDVVETDQLLVSNSPSRDHSHFAKKVVCLSFYLYAQQLANYLSFLRSLGEIITVWFMMKKKVLFSPLKGKQLWVSWFQGHKFPKIILLMTLAYSQNTERHPVFGFKAPDDNSRLLWRWTRDEARGGAVLHVICCSDVPSVSRMILVAVEEPMKISLPGLLQIHLFPSLCMTALHIIRQSRNRRTGDTSFKKMIVLSPRFSPYPSL